MAVSMIPLPAAGSGQSYAGGDQENSIFTAHQKFIDWLTIYSFFMYTKFSEEFFV